jgi:hypothetical protein
LAGTKTLKDELARLVLGLRRAELQELWHRMFHCEPPEQISRQLLAQAIGHRMQVKALGGLSFHSRRALESASEDQGSKRARKSSSSDTDTGTILVRVWHGESHQVQVLKVGVEYRGRRYRSLSEVARAITGTRWSGPAFFGLKDAAKRRIATR